jgi:hypothetical protein
VADAEAEAEALAVAEAVPVPVAEAEVEALVDADDLADGVLEDENAWVVRTRVSTTPTKTTPAIGP